jgi:hypothetical protein
MKDPATAIEKILSDADALIRLRMKAVGIAGDRAFRRGARARGLIFVLFGIFTIGVQT